MKKNSGDVIASFLVILAVALVGLFGVILSCAIDNQLNPIPAAPAVPAVPAVLSIKEIDRSDDGNIVLYYDSARNIYIYRTGYGGLVTVVAPPKQLEAK